MTTGATVHSMPRDRPLMMTVALPVSLEALKFRVGL